MCDLYDLIIITAHVIEQHGYHLQIGNVTFDFSTFFNYQVYVILPKSQIFAKSGDDMTCDEHNYSCCDMFWSSNWKISLG